jgi:DoxX-like family
MKCTSKQTKIIYWSTTILLAVFILPGIFQINSQMALEGIKHLGGFPEWFRYEVSIGSFIGGLLLIIPTAFVGKRLKERGYVGLGIVYISAFIAHATID